MPPFKPGWILLQVARPARSIPIRLLSQSRHSVARLASSKTRPPQRDNNSAKSIEDDKFRVNIYDEDESGTARRRTRPNEVPAEDRELDTQIEELERELQDDELPDSMSEDTLQALFTDDERHAMMSNLRRILTDSAVLPHQVHPSSTIPRQSKIYLDKLNQVLDQASLQSSRAQLRKDIWKWYERCKTNVPEFLRMVPKEAWDIIWQSQSAGRLGNVDRSSHLRVIAQDKVTVGWTLSAAEQLAQLEGLYLDGRRTEAIDEWMLLREDQSQPDKSLLETGLHMLALDNQAQRAQQAMEDLFHHYPQTDARAALSVISCHCKNKDVPAAWALYRRLLDMLQSDVQMADFDEVCQSFLAIGEKNAALAVFRDMILFHEQGNTLGSIQPIKRFSELVGLSQGSHDINRTSLESMTFLPRRFQNKMFYASWIKKLIGEDDVDAASLVIDLMYERGISPDAKHMNGLIGAWLRDGFPTSRKAAEERAWTMIQKRIDFSKARRLSKSPQAAVHKRAVTEHGADIQVPIAISRPVPPATIETFCLLVQHYLRRNEFGHVRHLRDLLVDAEIPMNSFFMNHLLHAELRNHGYRSVYSRFEVMSKDVRPDFETWIVLWQCMKHHLDTVKNQDATGFPSPRNLFAQMLQWYFSLNGQEAARSRDELDIEGYNDILRGFCLARDLEGVFVAMHALHNLFGILPDEHTAHMLILMIARLDIRPATKQWLAHRATRSKRNVQNIAHTTEVLDIIRKHRKAQMEELGLEISGLSPEARALENHRTLLSLVFAVISRRSESQDAYHGAINLAAGEMGVDQFDVQHSMALTGPASGVAPV